MSGSGDGLNRGSNGINVMPDTTAGYTPQMWADMRAKDKAFSDAYFPKSWTTAQRESYIKNMTPQQMTAMDAAQNNWAHPETSFEHFAGWFAPLVSMAALGAGVGAVAGGAASAGGAGTEAATASVGSTGLGGYGGGVFAPTDVLASTAELAPGAVSDSVLGSAAFDFTSTASALPALSGSAVSGGIGGAGFGAVVNPADLGGITPTDYNVGNFTKAKTFSDYTPKNIVSDYLKGHGAPGWAANAGGGAVQNSLVSGVTGGDPVKGALGGAAGSLVGSAVGATGIPSDVSSAFGGGTVGDIAGKVAGGALTAGTTSAIFGGDPLKAAETGGLSSGISGGLTDVGVNSNIAGIMGSQAGSAITGSGGSRSNSTPATTNPAVAGQNMASTPAGTSDPNAPTLSSSGSSDIFGNVLSSVGSALGSIPISTAASTAMGLYEANQAKDYTNKTVAPLANVGNDLVNKGTAALDSYKTLTPTEQAALNAGVGGGTNLTQEAQPLIGIGQSAMNQYGQGQLPPWQQQQLDQQIQAAKASAMQSMGSNIDSSTMAQINAQIDAQGVQAKNAILQQNLTSGEQAYKQGTDLQGQGQLQIQQAYQQATTDIQNNLKDALAQITEGLGPLGESILMQIQSNTALTGQLQALFGAIAKGAAGGAGGGSNASGTIVSLIKSFLGGSGGGATGGASPGNVAAPGYGAMDPYANIVPNALPDNPAPATDPSWMSWGNNSPDIVPPTTIDYGTPVDYGTYGTGP